MIWVAWCITCQECVYSVGDQYAGGTTAEMERPLLLKMAQLHRVQSPGHTVVAGESFGEIPMLQERSE